MCLKTSKASLLECWSLMGQRQDILNAALEAQNMSQNLQAGCKGNYKMPSQEFFNEQAGKPWNSSETKFRYSRKCSLQFRGVRYPEQFSFFNETLGKICNVDSCDAHVKSLRDTTRGKIDDIQTWKSTTMIDMYGRRVGGKICSYLPRYAYWIIVLVLLNFFFHLKMFLSDFTPEKLNPMEMIFVLLCVYPQWQLIKILASYFKHKDEDKLNCQIVAYDRDVATVEAFLEATIQVFAVCKYCYSFLDLV